jgi:septum formation protein
VTRLVLASASPRRRDLLAQLGLAFEVIAADVDETPRAGEDPVVYVQRLSTVKAAAVLAAAGPDALVIAADTTVDVGGRILGKPVDADDARARCCGRCRAGRIACTRA